MKQTYNGGRNYPSPCGKCNRESCLINGSTYKVCDEYRKWLSWWWKRFKVLFYRPEQDGKAEKFVYAHPDQVRRYLQEGPCAGCKVRENCDIPCRAYLHWWDARMEITRKKVGL